MQAEAFVHNGSPEEADKVMRTMSPLLDEMNYVPSSFYAKGPEIFAHCQAIARRTPSAQGTVQR